MGGHADKFGIDVGEDDFITREAEKEEEVFDGVEEGEFDIRFEVINIFFIKFTITEEVFFINIIEDFEDDGFNFISEDEDIFFKVWVIIDEAYFFIIFEEFDMRFIFVGFEFITEVVIEEDIFIFTEVMVIDIFADNFLDGVKEGVNGVGDIIIIFFKFVGNFLKDIFNRGDIREIRSFKFINRGVNEDVIIEDIFDDDRIHMGEFFVG